MKKFVTKRKVFAACGVALVCAAALWHFALAPRWTQRVAPGWSWRSDFVGTMSFPDPQSGELPEKDTTVIFERGLRVASEAERPRAVVLEDFYVTRDPATGAKTWEYRFSAPVDPLTGAYTQKEYEGDIYVFPRDVEKKTYKFRYNYIGGVPVAFRGEEDVEGINTYLFAYKGRGEYTESYAGTADYPGVPVEPGQEIKCVDDQFVFKVWVEPLTGEIVKLEESCHSGDYVHDAAGRPVTAVARWEGVTAGDDVIRRAETVRAERAKYLWAARYVPSGLLLSGFLCFGLAALPKKARGGR